MMSIYSNGIAVLPDGSGCFIGVIDPEAPLQEPIRWNPYCKVIMDHRTGTIHHDRTNVERARRGLPIPWRPEIGRREVHEAPCP